jgi:UDP-N-acetylmuramoylalanine--D-glutamate ligase
VKNDWQGRKVLVLGLGDTGLSCIRWLSSRGAVIRAADSRAAPPGLGEVRSGYPQVDARAGSLDKTLLEGMDTVVASPGLALREPVLQAAARRGIEILGDVEIFAREVRGGKARVIGITGTNGKSTVTALAGEMCRAAGLDTVVAGNIGLPVLDALQQGASADLYVIELSSYQLETTSSLELEAAAMLNLTQDHMDRYDSMADYARAKQRIFMHAKRRVVNRDDPRSRAMGDADAFSFGLSQPRNGNEWGLDQPARTSCAATSRWSIWATWRSRGCTTPPMPWPPTRSLPRSCFRPVRCSRR